MSESAPLIIGATGGSGTRVVARLARRAGYNLGAALNEAEDALAFRSFHDTWINRFLPSELQGRTLSQDIAAQMGQAFQAALAGHLSSLGLTESRWGWKAPRTIYLLPFLRSRFPEFKFVHVIRDGRDMAFSKNQNQLRKHGGAVLSWRERWFNPRPLQSILLWQRINLLAAAYGEAQMKENYHRVRFEDLCDAPIKTTERLMQFLGVDFDAESVAREEISPPGSIRRWRRESPELVARLERLGAVSLEKFGYLS